MDRYSAPVKTSNTLRLTICGCGASAVLLLNALRGRAAHSLNVTIIEPRADLGLGAAYSTTCRRHLLNTRAGNMSAGEAPDDFLNWLRRKHPRRPLNWTRNDFAPRALYGEYLRATLHELQSAPDIHLRWVHSAADAIVKQDGEWQIVLARGAPVRADVVVLATGNEVPRALGADLSPRAQSLILDDPWNAAAKRAIPRDAGVLLAGTGLTAVDVAIEMLDHGHTGPIYAVSRRGLLPRRHAPTTQREEYSVAWHASPRNLLRQVRALIAQSDGAWQSIINELRSVAPTLWAHWNFHERRRFLRHLRPFWDAHRHRLPPAVHARLMRAVSRGQIKILRGRIRELEPFEGSLRVRLWQLDGERLLDVGRVINCTGPESDPRRTQNPLLQSLVSDSLARVDALGLGLEVDRYSRVISADGAIHPTLYALGSLARGSRWELTAIAEIRDQAREIARKLAQPLAFAPNRGLRLGLLGSYPHPAA